MAKVFAKPFYDSKAWKQCRAAFISERILIDGGMCEDGCGELGYIVDHKEELTPENISDPEITLNHENLQYLSLVCHNRKTFGIKTDDTSYYFDADGQIVPCPPKNNGVGIF